MWTLSNLAFEFLIEWPAYHIERFYYSDVRNLRSVEYKVGVPKTDIILTTGEEDRNDMLQSLTLKQRYDRQMLDFRLTAQIVAVDEAGKAYVTALCSKLRDLIHQLPQFSETEFNEYVLVCGK